MDKFEVMWKGQEVQSHRATRKGTEKGWQFPPNVWIQIVCTLCGGTGEFIPHSDTEEARRNCVKCRVAIKHACPQCQGTKHSEEDRDCFRSMAKMNPKLWAVREIGFKPEVIKEKLIDIKEEIKELIQEPAKVQVTEKKRLFRRNKKEED